MIVGSTKEDLSLEKRVALTPETAKNIIGLDTGCVWGNKLTFLRLEDQKKFTVKSA